MKRKYVWLCAALVALGSGASAQQPSESRGTGVSDQYSFEEVRAQVDALKKEDVAWRNIAWKTCLLDGLEASREQKKPIMLWVFIDRPIDDERC